MLHLVHDGAAAAQGREVVVVEDGGSSFRIKKTTAGGPHRRILRQCGDAEARLPQVRGRLPLRRVLPARPAHRGPPRVARPRGKGLEDLGRPGRRLMRVTFEYQPPDPKHARLSGWWTVTPDEGWSLQGYELHRVVNGGEETARGTVRYGDPVAGLPIPTHVESSFTGGGFRWGFEFSFDRFDCEAAPDRVFSLATYGLSPMDTSRRAGRAARAQPALRAGRMSHCSAASGSGCSPAGGPGPGPLLDGPRDDLLPPDRSTNLKGCPAPGGTNSQENIRALSGVSRPWRAFDKATSSGSFPPCSRSGRSGD